ncbi:MAG TPA: NAD(P)-dependent oxidoreductase [Pirellulales bacterium]|jgi:phosphoglycerate dehydrogenase-like enzyme|nr:NAD(P)-dependent oxidoreductase [Pirellulales bacterium]
MKVVRVATTETDASCRADGHRARCPITLTADFYDEAGKVRFPDIGLDALAGKPDVEVRRFDRHLAEVSPDQLADAQAVLVLSPRVTARSLQQAGGLLVLARFGVGYDTVDVAACTERDVLLTIARGAVDRPVAEATLAWMLALSYRVPLKDRLVREARWDERSQSMGQGLRDQTLGIIGFGGIGRELVRLLSGFGMRPPMVFDPHVPEATVAEHGGRSVPLDELVKQADFVSLHCPLTPQTRGLLGPRELALMKPTAYLINTARGGIVDECALDQALRSRQIAGAAIDCFVDEPLAASPRFADLDNVLLAPHAIAWTDELFRDLGRTALSSILDLRHGREPSGIVNPEVFERPGFQNKWRQFQDGQSDRPIAPAAQ